MLKIILIILCIFVIFYIYNNNYKKNGRIEKFINPYSYESNELISDIRNENDYELNLNNKDCFRKKNIIRRPLNISISFKNKKLNNFNNNKNKKLFCDDEPNYDTTFGDLLNDSLPYKSVLIHTGDSNDKNDEWEIIKLADKSPFPLYNIHPPKINKCGFLIRNIGLDRYLGYGDIKENIENYNINQDNIKKNVVFTGPSKYINYKYLWDIENKGCNTYSIRNVYTGEYLNSTIPNLIDDFVNNENNSINKYGELTCDKNDFTWFISPTKPLNKDNCNKNMKKCSKIFKKNYENIGVEGNCCYKKLKTKVCLHGSKDKKHKQILNYPSTPWCGITNICN